MESKYRRTESALAFLLEVLGGPLDLAAPRVLALALLLHPLVDLYLTLLVPSIVLRNAGSTFSLVFALVSS